VSTVQLHSNFGRKASHDAKFAVRVNRPLGEAHGPVDEVEEEENGGKGDQQHAVETLQLEGVPEVLLGSHVNQEIALKQIKFCAFGEVLYPAG
jgi:hypothetical protein